MRVYHDRDADLGLLVDRRIAVIGYGNQGRAQALNLRDSGLSVLVGNRNDDYANHARADGFVVQPIARAVTEARIVMLLIPDEVMPDVFSDQVAPGLATGDALVFASGYTVAFGQIEPPASLDVVLVAPRMIGAGVRELYVAGQGFPSFIGVNQDHSGQALALALALAKGIGSTRMGAVEVTFAQEAELDLFTEQCFGPAFGRVLTTAVELLLEEGYPPEAVLLELYMSGEFAYTLNKIAEMGLVEQSTLHSRTSQYGSLSRGLRFTLPNLRKQMLEGLEEIRSGAFAQEWAAEQAAGSPTLRGLGETARTLPLHEMEQELRQALGSSPAPAWRARASLAANLASPAPSGGTSAGFLRRSLTQLRRLGGRLGRKRTGPPLAIRALEVADRKAIILAFLALSFRDPTLQDYAQDRQQVLHYVLSDAGIEFYMSFNDGSVTGDFGPPAEEAQLQLTAPAGLLDGILSGRINAMRAAMSGKLSFVGDARQALSMQRIQPDLIRLYRRAKEQVASGKD
jgi:ketol-acid reductoisomerase